MWMWNGVLASTLGCQSGGSRVDSFPNLSAHLLFLYFFPFAGLNKKLRAEGYMHLFKINKEYNEVGSKKKAQHSNDIVSVVFT